MPFAHSFYHAKGLQQTSITRYVNAKLEAFSRERKRQSVSQSKANTQQSLLRMRKGREGTDRGREIERERESREKERGTDRGVRQTGRRAGRQTGRQRHNNNNEYLER